MLSQLEEVCIHVVFFLSQLRFLSPCCYGRVQVFCHSQLKRKLKHQTTKEVAGDFSQLMRRIAIARCGRSRTAALTGERWLEWLQQNDHSGFDWEAQGRLLLHLPYAPPGQDSDRAALGRVIDAALRWVSSEEACRV